MNRRDIMGSTALHSPYSFPKLRQWFLDDGQIGSDKHLTSQSPVTARRAKFNSPVNQSDFSLALSKSPLFTRHLYRSGLTLKLR
jgi:hypothetical protein